MKAREFWIIKNDNHHTGLEWYDAFKTPQSWINLKPKPQIHVIEKAQVDSLLDEVELTIQRLLKSDEECGHPFDENLGELLNKFKEFRSNE